MWPRVWPMPVRAVRDSPCSVGSAVKPRCMEPHDMHVHNAPCPQRHSCTMHVRWRPSVLMEDFQRGLAGGLAVGSLNASLSHGVADVGLQFPSCHSL